MSPGRLLYAAIPAALLADLLSAPEAAVFVLSALGTIPAAGLMGRATEELAARSGPAIGGLLNVTFGNAPELIIALFALQAGLHEVVKASLAGSVVSNALLVLGASMLAGGLTEKARSSSQSFERLAASAQSGMLLLAVGALILPAVLVLSGGGQLPSISDELQHPSGDLQTLTVIVCLTLLLVYAAGLIFSLVTHAKLFAPAEDPEDTTWSTGKAIGLLAFAGVLVAIMSEVLVGSIEGAASGLGLSEFFIGAIVVAIVGNAAEHWVAVAVARRDQMDLAVGIAVGSAAQVALFVTPVLFLASFVLGPGPMSLAFNGYELAALLLSALVAGAVCTRGRSTWFEGLQLIALYLLVAATFLFA